MCEPDPVYIKGGKWNIDFWKAWPADAMLLFLTKIYISYDMNRHGMSFCDIVQFEKEGVLNEKVEKSRVSSAE